MVGSVYIIWAMRLFSKSNLTIEELWILEVIQQQTRNSVNPFGENTAGIKSAIQKEVLSQNTHFYEKIKRLSELIDKFHLLKVLHSILTIFENDLGFQVQKWQQ